MDITPKEIVYLLLAIVGLFVTWTFNIQWMVESESPSFVAFFEQGYLNHATTSLPNDLLVVFLVFCVWVIAEARASGMKHGWAYIPLAAFIALAVAFPLFLFQRSRTLRRLPS